MNYFDFYLRLSAVTISKLHEKYQDQIPLEDLEGIIRSDPTYPGGDQVGSYGPWLVKQYLQGSFDLSMSNEMITLLNEFTRYKPNLEKKDIYTYQSVDELHQAVAPFIYYQPNEEETSAEPSILYDDGIWVAVKPNTFEEECFYGQKTTWCTKSNSSMFQKYQGNLFIIINRKENKKFQFDLKDYQFKNEKNQEDLEGFLNLNPPQELLTSLGIQDILTPPATAPELSQVQVAVQERISKFLSLNQDNEKMLAEALSVVNIPFDKADSLETYNAISNTKAVRMHYLQKMIQNTPSPTIDIIESLAQDPKYVLLDNALNYLYYRNSAITTYQNIANPSTGSFRDKALRLNKDPFDEADKRHIHTVDIENNTISKDRRVSDLVKEITIDSPKWKEFGKDGELFTSNIPRRLVKEIRAFEEDEYSEHNKYMEAVFDIGETFFEYVAEAGVAWIQGNSISPQQMQDAKIVYYFLDSVRATDPTFEGFFMDSFYDIWPGILSEMGTEDLAELGVNSDPMVYFDMGSDILFETEMGHSFLRFVFGIIE
jgi:hypothetical protein